LNGGENHPKPYASKSTSLLAKYIHADFLPRTQINSSPKTKGNHSIRLNKNNLNVTWRKGDSLDSKLDHFMWKNI
jgi:hypothetical protein